MSRVSNLESNLGVELVHLRSYVGPSFVFLQVSGSFDGSFHSPIPRFQEVIISQWKAEEKKRGPSINLEAGLKNDHKRNDLKALSNHLIKG